RWPEHYWKELLQALIVLLPEYSFVFVGSKSDHAIAQRLMGEVDECRVHNFCGALSVLESAYLLERSEGLITVDNGISHLAAATRVPRIFVLYGPTLLSKNVPLHEDVYVFNKELG